MHDKKLGAKVVMRLAANDTAESSNHVTTTTTPAWKCMKYIVGLRFILFYGKCI